MAGSAATVPILVVGGKAQLLRASSTEIRCQLSVRQAKQQALGVAGYSGVRDKAEPLQLPLACASLARKLKQTSSQERRQCARYRVFADHSYQTPVMASHFSVSATAGCSREVLGPPWMVAEVPEAFRPAGELFSACGYVQESASAIRCQPRGARTCSESYRSFRAHQEFVRGRTRDRATRTRPLRGGAGRDHQHGALTPKPWPRQTPRHSFQSL